MSLPATEAKVSINLNTVLTTVVGAITIWIVTSTLSTGNENNKELVKISTTFPFMQASLLEVKTSLLQMVTRAEFDAKQSQVTSAIDRITIEQERVRTELNKAKIK